jgi:ribose 5-phosphate isomerase B
VEGLSKYSVKVEVLWMAVKELLLICTGNTCRSSIAEAILRDMLKKYEASGRLKISSAGLAAQEGSGASQGAIEVMREYGIDLAQHRSRQLTLDMLQCADLVLTMTPTHKNIVVEMSPDEKKSNVFTLYEFATDGKDTVSRIVDPFGGDIDVYRKCSGEIWTVLKSALDKIVRYLNLDEEEVDSMTGSKRLCMGSDHGGYELKEHIKSFFDELGVEYDDFGTFCEDCVDYPDIGLQVAKAVARGDYKRGLLFCGTGIGMSIIANKVEGIRAALCHDVFSARASREHNDSNILVMGGRIIGKGLARLIVEEWLSTEFLGGRHERRIGKIADYERNC